MVNDRAKLSLVEPAKIHVDLLREWIFERTGEELNLGLVPPLGVFAEREGIPVACVYAHLSVGCGVAWLEHAATAPGLGVSESRECLGFAVRGILKILKVQDYSVVNAFTYSGLAKYLEEDHGFEIYSTRATCLLKTL